MVLSVLTFRVYYTKLIAPLIFSFDWIRPASSPVLSLLVSLQLALPASQGQNRMEPVKFRV